MQVRALGRAYRLALVNRGLRVRVPSPAQRRLAENPCPVVLLRQRQRRRHADRSGRRWTVSVTVVARMLHARGKRQVRRGDGGQVPAGFGSLRRLPSGRWQASFVGPDLVRRPAPQNFDTKGDAEGWLGRRRGEVLAGDWQPPVKVLKVAPVTLSATSSANFRSGTAMRPWSGPGAQVWAGTAPTEQGWARRRPRPASQRPPADPSGGGM